MAVIEAERIDAAEVTASTGRPKRHGLELVGLSVVLLVTAARSYSRTDIAMWDELFYMDAGLDIGSGRLPRFIAGATYSDLYFILSWVVRDPIDLYLWGRALSAVALVLGVWIAARLLSNAALAWCAAAVIAVSPAPYVWPGVATPAAGMVLVGLALVVRRPGSWSLPVATALFWMAAGARPELVWFAALCTVLVIVDAVRGRVDWLTSLVGVVTPAVLFALHGLPIATGNRSWLAFGQHFSQRHARPGEDPWLDWAQITDRTFPGADSSLGALAANPVAFSRHIQANLSDVVGVTRLDVLTVEGSVVGMMLPMFALGVVLAIADAGGARRRVSAISVDRRAVVVVLGLVASCIPALVIYPRAHYLLVPAGVVVVGLAATAHRFGTQRYVHLVPTLALALLFSMFALTTLDAGMRRYNSPPGMTAAARTMSESDVEWRMLSVDLGFEILVPGLVRFDNVQPLPGETIGDLLDRLDINAMQFNQRFRAASWSDTEGFDEFVRAPHDHGFRPIGGDVFVSP